MFLYCSCTLLYCLAGIQQIYTAIQHIHTAIQKTHTEIQQFHTAIQKIHTAIQLFYTAIQQIFTAFRAVGSVGKKESPGTTGVFLFRGVCLYALLPPCSLCPFFTISYKRLLSCGVWGCNFTFKGVFSFELDILICFFELIEL